LVFINLLISFLNPLSAHEIPTEHLQEIMPSYCLWCDYKQNDVVNEKLMIKTKDVD